MDDIDKQLAAIKHAIQSLAYAIEWELTTGVSDEVDAILRNIDEQPATDGSDNLSQNGQSAEPKKETEVA
jgi:hypothetical protein